LVAVINYIGFYDDLASFYDRFVTDMFLAMDFNSGTFSWVDIDLYLCLGTNTIVGLVSFGLFLVSREPYALIFLSNFRMERDVNRVLIILTLLASGVMLIVPLFLFSYWATRKYENHVTISAGDPVVHDPKYSYFMARLCYLREIYRGSFSEIKNYILIHPKILIIEEALRTGFLILGGVGSGKTNIIYNWFIMPFLRMSGYRLLIYDQKGDFSSVLGDRSDTVIVSPFLENSYAWHIGRDINTSAAMVEYLDLLGSFDDQQKSTFFIGAFVDFGTAVFMHLRNENGEDWTFKDLFDTMQSVDLLFKIVKQYRPQAEMFAKKDEEIDQARGVLGTIREKLIKIEAIARAWQSGQEKISLNEFFSRDGIEGKRVLIVRGDKKYKALNKAFCTTYLDTGLKILVNGPEEDSKIAISFDELQTLGRIPTFIDVPRVGRSKGLRFHAGTQDFSVTDRQYQEEGGRKGIESVLSNKLVGMMPGGDESESAAKSFKFVNKERWKKDPKTRKWNVSSENNIQSLVSGSLSLPKPTLKRPAYFYFKHSDWPIMKLSFRIKPMPEPSFEAIPALWLSDSDLLEDTGQETESQEGLSQEPEQIPAQPASDQTHREDETQTSEESEQSTDTQTAPGMDTTKQSGSDPISASADESVLSPSNLNHGKAGGASDQANKSGSGNASVPSNANTSGGKTPGKTNSKNSNSQPSQSLKGSSGTGHRSSGSNQSEKNENEPVTPQNRSGPRG
ncbi:MAG: type IV secretion system DNA-binding domain-containing protein, partial [Pseudobacteriovorax sp.]|nr:type IV secretion system DNA-binding domain-containing protein [Pseudobacteriovorax sp.]